MKAGWGRRRNCRTVERSTNATSIANFGEFAAKHVRLFRRLDVRNSYTYGSLHRRLLIFFLSYPKRWNRPPPSTPSTPAIMLGRMASAARLGASGGADLSSEAAAKDANASGGSSSQGTSDGPAGGGTGITTAASSSSAAAAAAAGTTAAQQHPNLIGIIVGKMAKIQREGRGRRYRVSSGACVFCFFWFRGMST